MLMVVVVIVVVAVVFVLLLRGSVAGYELLDDGNNRVIILKGEIGYTVSRSHNEVEWKEEGGIAGNIGVVSEAVAWMVDFFFLFL